MHKSVKEGFPPHLRSFEGVIHHMYLDIRGRVTAGIGFLMDPFERYGGNLDFVWKVGESSADYDAVREEFGNVKNMQWDEENWPKKRWQNAKNFEDFTNLRLTNRAIDEFLKRVVGWKETDVRGKFGTAYDNAPADAQVVLLQMSYAGGLEKRAAALKEHVEKGDWWAAREFTNLGNGYPTYNAAFGILMRNASIAAQCAALGRTDIQPSEFYGMKTALGVGRWLVEDPEVHQYKVRKDDVVFASDWGPWVRKQR